MSAVAFPTRATHPRLGWQTPADAPWIHYAIVTKGAGLYIYVYSTRSGATFERPCSHRRMALARVADFARQYG